MSSWSQLFGSRQTPPFPTLSAQQAQARLRETPAPFLLDVRQPEEYIQERIDGAHLIPLGELGRRLDELPMDADIICVCHLGSRSSHATRELVKLGYRAINLNGGMDAWTRTGLPVTRGPGK
jgi:rhodanese-related sulfurtransferase